MLANRGFNFALGVEVELVKDVLRSLPLLVCLVGGPKDFFYFINAAGANGIGEGRVDMVEVVGAGRIGLELLDEVESFYASWVISTDELQNIFVLEPGASNGLFVFQNDSFKHKKLLGHWHSSLHFNQSFDVTNRVRRLHFEVQNSAWD